MELTPQGLQDDSGAATTHPDPPQASSGAHSGRSEGVRRLRKLLNAYLKQRVELGEIKRSTAIQDGRLIVSMIDGCKGKLTAQRVERWWRTQKQAPGTRRHKWSRCRLFTQWLQMKGRLRSDPFVNIRRPKVPRSLHRALDHDAAAAVLDACEDRRARVVVLLGLQVGLRREEIARLELGGISWSAKTLFVRGKGDHERYVPLTVELEAELRAYLREQPLTAGPLIRSKRSPNKGIGTGSVWLIVDKAARAAGVKLAACDGVSTHALRHTAATDVARRTRDPLAVKGLLGHADLSTTTRYIADLDVGALAEACAGRTYGKPTHD